MGSGDPVPRPDLPAKTIYIFAKYKYRCAWMNNKVYPDKKPVALEAILSESTQLSKEGIEHGK